MRALNPWLGVLGAALIATTGCAFTEPDWSGKTCSGVCPLGFICSAERTCQPAANAAEAGLCGKLLPESSMAPGNVLRSCDGRFQLTLQFSGLLTLQFGSQLLWTSESPGRPKHLYMQSDGNLVLYSDRDEPMWVTATYDNYGASLELRDDGNLVIQKSGVVVWQTNTCCH